MSRHRAVLAIASCATVAILAGCSGDAVQAGNDAAVSEAATITLYLRTEVVRPGLPATQQLAKVRNWLAAPSADFVRAYGEPHLRVLASTGQRVDFVVYQYGRTTALDGKNGAWGRSCQSYTVDAAARLQVGSISCPDGLPTEPSG